MKALYIGHYREFGGWSDAAIGHMLAMDTVGIDVVARNIPLTQSPRGDIPKKRALRTVMSVFSTFSLIT